MEMPRFLQPADIAELLSTSVVQVMALIKSGELRGIQVGGRGQWRIEVKEYEAYVARQYAAYDAKHPSPAPQHDQAGKAD